MKQLSGLDASFLYMETEATFGHVSSLSIYEPPDAEYQPYEAWKNQLAARLHLLEPLTRRLVNVPFNLDHPFWIDDPHFDLDFHVRRTAVPNPGGPREVTELVEGIIGRPLDRSHPLWESYVIEGLDGGRFAILTKIHHATVDGASGTELLALMLEQSPEGDAVVDAGSFTVSTEPVPSDNEVLGAALQSLARKPARNLVLVSRTLRAFGQASNNPVLTAAGQQLRSQLRGPLGALLNRGRNRPELRDEIPVSPLPEPAPVVSWNAPITPHRSFAYRSVPLSTIKDIKNELGATLNDVVMAVCAGGIRTYLDARGELPEKPLVASVPVSIRTGDEVDKWTNRVSALQATLPTNEADPLERVRKVHESMVLAKELHDAIPAEMLTQFADFSPPAVFTRVSRAAARARAAGDETTQTNLTISNVPGPRESLYTAGARLQHFIPVSTVFHQQGLNITVQSYTDTLDFGLVGCAELVPDIWDLLDAIIEDIEALAELTGAGAVPTTAAPTTPAPTKKPAKKPAKNTAAKRAMAKKPVSANGVPAS